MTTRDLDDLTLAFVVLLVAGVMFATCTADAQPRREATPEETLAALCVHESGWDSPGDCWGIFAVLANQADARSFSSWLTFARVHSPRFFAGIGRNPWAVQLRDTDTNPCEAMGAGWTNARDHGARPSRREAFRDLVALAFEIIRTPPICAAMSWGSREDYATGTFAEAHRRDVFLACGENARQLYSRPGTL